MTHKFSDAVAANDVAARLTAEAEVSFWKFRSDLRRCNQLLKRMEVYRVSQVKRTLSHTLWELVHRPTSSLRTRYSRRRGARHSKLVLSRWQPAEEGPLVVVRIPNDKEPGKQGDRDPASDDEHKLPEMGKCTIPLCEQEAIASDGPGRRLCALHI